MARALRVVVAILACSVARAAWAQPLPVVDPEKVGLSPERLARLGEAIEAEIARKAYPGAVVAVARRGQLAYFESFGAQDPAAGRPMRRDAIFRIYSMTKPWTSVAAMVLVEEGRLRLLDPVSKHLPPLRGLQVSTRRTEPGTGKVTSTVAPAEREMTVYDLLRHTSGLVYANPRAPDEVRESYLKAGLGPDDADEKASATEWTERVSRVLLAHPPGTMWHYGLSSDVLGRVVEAVSGQRLSIFLEERVFRPLRMVDSAFRVPEGKRARLAQAFELDPRTGKKAALLDVLEEPGNDLGGVGGVATAADYLRFGQMLLAGGRLGPARILSRTTVSLMAADHLGTLPRFVDLPGHGFGLGFAVRLAAGQSALAGSPGDFGWNGAAGTFFWVDPKEELVGVLMVQAPGANAFPGMYLKQLVYQAIVD